MIIIGAYRYSYLDLVNFVTASEDAMHAQQKQIGCFNHRVVTLVADKLKRQWLCIVYFTNCIRQPERKLHFLQLLLVDIVTPDHAYLKEITPASISKSMPCSHSNLWERITTKSSFFL